MEEGLCHIYASKGDPLEWFVGGKLMKFALSAQARGEGGNEKDGERERERKAVAGKHVLSRVGEPL